MRLETAFLVICLAAIIGYLIGRALKPHHHHIKLPNTPSISVDWEILVAVAHARGCKIVLKSVWDEADRKSQLWDTRLTNQFQTAVKKKAH